MQGDGGSVLPINGYCGVFTPRIAGTYQITSDVVITARCSFYSSVGVQQLVGQVSGTTRNWRIYYNVGSLVFGWNDGANKTATLLTSAEVTALGTDEVLIGAKVERNVGGFSRVVCIRSFDAGATWVESGTPAVGTSPMGNTTDSVNLSLGDRSNGGGTDDWQGTISWAEMRTGTDPSAGTLKFRWDAAEVPYNVVFECLDMTVDTNADGIRDGWTVVETGTPTVSSFTPSIADGGQRLTATLANSYNEVELRTPTFTVQPSVIFDVVYVMKGSFVTYAEMSATLQSMPSGSAGSGFSQTTAAATYYTYARSVTPGAAVTQARFAFSLGGNGTANQPSGVAYFDLQSVRMRVMKYTDPRGLVWTFTSFYCILPAAP